MVDVSSQLSGRIADVPVNFNDIVKAGQVIARLDPEIYAARVSEAKASLSVAKATVIMQKAAIQRARVAVQNARTAQKVEEAQLVIQNIKHEELERDYQRNLNLSRTASVSQRDLTQSRAQRDAGAATLRVLEEQINLKAEAIDIAQAEVTMAEANFTNAQAVVEQKQATLDQAEVDRERTEIRAPIDGVVIKRDVNPGQTVAVTLEAKTLFKIAQDLREMEVRGRIDEADVGRLRVGQNATFNVDAYPDQMFAGRVQQIRKAAEVVQNVVTYTAIVSAPNPDLLLLPGMTAVLRVVTNETENSLKVSNQALRVRPAGAAAESAAVSGPGSPANGTVWIVDDSGAPVPVSIQLGASDENSTQVLSGALQEGQQVIVGEATPRSRAGIFGLRLGF
ncbi:MAG: HlyD family secretion protein [Acetobacteraceae bacterium]|nr:HlyD family secretion protein [Acetobacteraceae bacterium]